MRQKGEGFIKIVPMWSEHMDAVEEIENECFDEDAWSRKELEDMRRQAYHRSRIALISSGRQKLIVGAMFVEQDKFRFTLRSLGVRRTWRRRGIGTAFLVNLIGKLREDGRYEIYELVRERNLVAQKFFQSLGFVALKPKRGKDEDAYPMIYKWEWSPQGKLVNGEPDMCASRNHPCTGCGECDAAALEL